MFRALNLFWFMVEYLLDLLRYITSSKRFDNEKPEMDIGGKVVVMTGATSGIGKSIAMKLAQRGASLIIGCSDIEEGKQLCHDINTIFPNCSVKIEYLDLKDLSSVKAFAGKITSTHSKIHFLINNAGIALDSKELIFTPEGLEIHMCVNYMSHFLLTNLLLPCLKGGAPSRIVMVSSTMMLFSELDTKDLMIKSHPAPTKRNVCPITTLPYNNSKMAVSLFAKELGSRLKGTGVTCYSVCPGLTKNTNIFNDYSTFGRLFCEMSLKLVGITVDMAADCVMYCVVSPKCANESGLMYRFEKEFASANSKLTFHESRKLWQRTEDEINFINQ